MKSVVDWWKRSHVVTAFMLYVGADWTVSANNTDPGGWHIVQMVLAVAIFAGVVERVRRHCTESIGLFPVGGEHRPMFEQIIHKREDDTGLNVRRWRRALREPGVPVKNAGSDGWPNWMESE